MAQSVGRIIKWILGVKGFFWVFSVLATSQRNQNKGNTTKSVKTQRKPSLSYDRENESKLFSIGSHFAFD